MEPEDATSAYAFGPEFDSTSPRSEQPYYVEVEDGATPDADVPNWLRAWKTECKEREEHRHRELLAGLRSVIEETTRAIRAHTQAVVTDYPKGFLGASPGTTALPPVPPDVKTKSPMLTTPPTVPIHSPMMSSSPYQAVAPPPSFTTPLPTGPLPVPTGAHVASGYSPATVPTPNTPTTNTIVLARNPTRPAFREGKDPIRFLEGFEVYCRQMGITENHKLLTVLDCLSGDPRNWADIYKPTWGTFGDFHRDFLHHFWSETQQGCLRREIGSSQWEPSRNSMVQHFAYYVSRAKRLTSPIPETVLVMELLRHFPVAIQSLWQVCGGRTIREAYEFLTKQESTVETARSHVPPTGNPNTSQPGRSAPASRPKPYPTTSPRVQPEKPKTNNRGDRENRYHWNRQTNPGPRSGNGGELTTVPRRGQPNHK